MAGVVAAAAGRRGPHALRAFPRHVARVAGKLAGVSDTEREQRLVFGEVAEQYDACRPSYPDALFDTIIEFGGLQRGDRALEIGAGTGKATTGFVARGLDVHALEPSPEMAAVLRTKGVEVEETLFESWAPPAERVPARVRRAGVALGAAATTATSGSRPRSRRAAPSRSSGTRAASGPDALGADNDAAYARASRPSCVGGRHWDLDWVSDGIAACAAFEPPVRAS